ncbi:MAG: hypothetical protein A2622_07890 [Bdellovibrionales bacterium RIFCSPHIGHO2_01_FULL_40_29]|nr:MAG: hypothetical protein A2622_07890 [Bdellovibrionales bacterium RIFCSPHIGHO2_01_FULL_40_29]OFZ33727.1 MAG: hypothetical protein A3D17_09980 [Bdellovibrionales bacterium RIFCSPHIGHO2_02_FULL_40_15]
MNSKLVLVIGLAAFLYSCASTHPGKEGHALDGKARLPIKISAEILDENAKDPFQLIEVTFENTSDEWLRITKNSVIIDNPADSRVSVVLGQDLIDWASAIELRQKKEQHNKELLQAGLIIGSALVGGANKNNSVGTAAGVTMVATSAWVVADTIRMQIKKVEGINKVPDTHLNHSVMIPGQTFARRWVLLNKPANTKINRLVVQTETIDGQKEVYDIDL